MTVASISGPPLPGLDQGSALTVVGGVSLARCSCSSPANASNGVRTWEEKQWAGEGGRASLLVFVVLFVHSLPEGLAIGTAYASNTAGLSLFVILAIAVQNIPEGTSIAIPMATAGFSRARQFWAAVATSAPQPVGAVVAYLLVRHVEGLLPFSFGFAAGAMLALVVVELLPNALRGNRRAAFAGAATGAAAMLGLSAALGV